MPMYVTSFKSMFLNYQSNATCIFLMLFIVIALSSCTPAREHVPSKENFNVLMKLNDLNERAFAYHKHCLKNTEPMNEVFLANFEQAANMLFDESMNMFRQRRPEDIVRKILERRNSMQNTLDKIYRADGCQSSEAKTAQEHYSTFSQLGKEKVKQPVVP